MFLNLYFRKQLFFFALKDSLLFFFLWLFFLNNFFLNNYFLFKPFGGFFLVRRSSTKDVYLYFFN